MSGLVTDAQLAALRRVGYRQLVTPYTVWRKTRVESDFGTSESWSQVGSGMGWLRMINRPHTIEQVGFIEGATEVYRFHTDVAVDITNGDRLHMWDQDYEVHDVNSDDTVQVFRTCLLRRVE